MIYYSFYTTWNRKPESLVYRTLTGHSEFKTDLKFFDNKGQAEKDFFQLLWDNEDYRIGEYFDTESKKKKDIPVVVAKPKEEKRFKEYIDIEKNFVYNEKAEMTMSRMPDKLVDYIITSPPYNVGKGIRNDGDGLYEDYEDNLSDEKYEEWLFGIVDECLRVTKQHVFFNIQMLGKNKATVLNLLGTYRHKIKDLIMWNKAVAPPHIQEGVMNSKFEFIIIFSNQKPQSKKFTDGNFKGNFNNVIEGKNASANKYAKLNKATYPLYLPRTIMKYFGRRGDLIYDPFNGTGTTGEACIIEGRDYIGSEMDLNQCLVTNRRLMESKQKIRMFL